AVSAPAVITFHETRSVAEGTATIDNDGVLRIGGTSKDDVISIGKVRVSQLYYVQVTLGGTPIGRFLLDSVRAVKVWGRSGNDNISTLGLPINAMLDGGAGDDSLTAGS